MGKHGSTLAEIFIVLALLFLIQTVINFGVHEKTAKPKTLPLFESLTLRQVPSQSSDFDHINYLRIETPKEAMRIFLARSSSKLGEHKIHSHLSTDGAPNLSNKHRCSQHEPAKSEEIFGMNSLGTYRDLVAEKFGISIDIVNASGSHQGIKQRAFVFTWPSNKLQADTRITLGTSLCNIAPSASTRSVHRDWGLNVNQIKYPHPLIVEHAQYGLGGVKKTQDMHYFNKAQLANSPLEKPFNRLVFENNVASCDNARFDWQNPDKVDHYGGVAKEISLRLN